MQCYNEPFPHPCTIRLSEKCGFASGPKYSLEHKCIFPLFLFTSIRNFSKPALFPRRGEKKENLRFRERKLEEIVVIITRKREIETKLWKIFTQLAGESVEGRRMVEATSIFPKKNRVDLIREEAGKGKRSDRRREWSVSLAWSGTRRISQDRSELEELGEAMEAARKVKWAPVSWGQAEKIQAKSNTSRLCPLLH